MVKRRIWMITAALGLSMLAACGNATGQETTGQTPGGSTGQSVSSEKATEAAGQDEVKTSGNTGDPVTEAKESKEPESEEAAERKDTESGQSAKLPENYYVGTWLYEMNGTIKFALEVREDLGSSMTSLDLGNLLDTSVELADDGIYLTKDNGVKVHGVFEIGSGDECDRIALDDGGCLYQLDEATGLTFIETLDLEANAKKYHASLTNEESVEVKGVVQKDGTFLITAVAGGKEGEYQVDLQTGEGKDLKNGNAVVFK